LTVSLPDPIDSQLNDFLNEIHQIARFEPSIVERIDEDLDLHAKKKKLLRLADAQFLAVCSGGNTTKGNGSRSKSGSDFYHGPSGEGLGVYRSVR
jgi:hypothetical protein